MSWFHHVILALFGGTVAHAPAAAHATPAPPPSLHAGDARVLPPSAHVAPAGASSRTTVEPAAPGTVVAAFALASVDDGAASDRPAYARTGQAVRLWAVLDVLDHGRHRYFTDAPAARLHGKALHASPLSQAPAVTLTWNRVEPAAADYSNTDTGSFHFTRIAYRVTPIADTGGHASIAADVRPTLTPDHGHGLGTMRFQVVATQDGRRIASAGPEAQRTRGSGGLTDAVMRVTIRKDDSYLGYLTEMYGQPYIWASAGLSDRTHQSERLEGSDCADFVVYGARREGKHIAYTWTGGLPRVTRLLGAGTRGADGIYRDAQGAPVPFPRAGDLIVFPRHVGALVEDRGTAGVLDDQDLVFHTLFDSPKIEPLATTGYADKPAELRRFR